MEVITLLEKLETFKIVYETQNFSKAAELLFVSQPTVSAHIKQLEEELNTQLFIRNGRMNISATPQAHLLYQRGLNLLDDWQHLYQEINKVRNSWFHAGSVFPILLRSICCRIC